MKLLQQGNKAVLINYEYGFDEIKLNGLYTMKSDTISEQLNAVLWAYHLFVVQTGMSRFTKPLAYRVVTNLDHELL